MIRTIVYTGFDLAESIVRDELTPEGRIQAQVSFKYGTDRGMFKRVDGGTGGSGSNCASPDGMFCSRFEDGEQPVTTGTAVKTTYYVGNVEFIREGITNSTKRYIGGYLVITTVGNNAATFDYLLRDSLGSIDTIASETGVLKSRQSFNAHGQRRTAATTVAGSWNVLNPLQISLFNTSTTTQGYTGHEQLDGVGLIHMGARLYDPELGRFIQADDFVEPEATQGLNRYSYVLNNPLSATDPTGNFSLRQGLALVVAVVAAYFGQYWLSQKLLGYAFLTVVAGGFLSGAIATGTLKGALWGAASAAAFFGIGTYFQGVAGINAEAVKAGTMKATQLMQSGLTSGQTLAKIAAHAGAGGTLSVLQGGKFGHGFVAAGFTEALSPAVGQFGEGTDFGSILARTATSAAIGGTASKLSGGSFANGAKTGAFQQLFGEFIDPSSTDEEGDSELGKPMAAGADGFSASNFEDSYDLSGLRRGEGAYQSQFKHFNESETYDVIGHGSGNTRMWFNGRTIGAPRLSELVTADKNFTDRPRHVNLHVCNAGRGLNPLARRLANILGVPVSGPTRLGLITKQGNYRPQSPGVQKWFVPDSWLGGY